MKILSVSCLLLFVIGCGGSESDAPTLYPAKGSVFYNGKALTNAQVILIADKGGNVAVGTSDSSGAFQLATKGQNGAVLGTHKVRVTAIDSGGTTPAEGSEEYEKMMSGQAPAPKSPVPEKFGVAETSGLTATITEGDNVITLELKD